MKRLPQTEADYLVALGRDYFGYLLTNGVTTLGSLLLLPIITRALAPEEIGLYGLVDAANLIAGTFSLLGLKFAYLYFHAQIHPPQRASLLGTAFAIVTFAAAAAGLLLTAIFSSDTAMAIFGAAALPHAWLLLPLMITGGWQTLLHTEQRAERQVKAAGLISITQLAIWLASSAVLVLHMDAGLPGIFIGQILGQVTACLLALLALRNGQRLADRFGWDSAQVAPLIRYGLPIMLGLVLRYSLDALSRFMLAAVAGIDAAADFLIASRMATLFDGLLAFPFFTAWGGLVHHALKHPQAPAILARTSGLAALACAALIWLLVLLQPWLFALLADGARPDLAGLFAMILLSKAVFVLRSPLGAGIYVTGKTGWAVTNTLISLAAFAMLAWPAMSLAGSYGAALAIFTANVIGCLFLIHDSQKLLRQPISATVFAAILGTPLLVIAGTLMPEWAKIISLPGLVLLLPLGLALWRNLTPTNHSQAPAAERDRT